jgi:hypothetical protein
MHRLSHVPAAAFIDAAMPALRLGSPALLLAARRPGPRPPPWLRFGGGGGGARRGMLCSAEAARRGGDEETEDERRVGRAAAERRLRGGSGNAAVGSVELLAIPGVGPRNLRKLVDKGFDGVAQLKQLYRDKVCLLLFRNILFCESEVIFRTYLSLACEMFVLYWLYIGRLHLK